MNVSTKFQTELESSLDEVERSVICTLIYFDIFNYPLKLAEIVKFSRSEHVNFDNVQASLSRLVQIGVVHCFDSCYTLGDNPAVAERRRKGNNLALKRFKSAKIYSGLISSFPFVRSVMLSGSLSKDYMEESSDLDYFIITEPGRVWLTRALLAIFKRMFLFNSHRNFCTNYFIDTDSLEIQEKNLYTAIETATLIPVYGKTIWQDFLINNSWRAFYLPNHESVRTAFGKDGRPLVKRFLERLLSGRVADRLDNFFMRMAINRWKKQFASRFTEEDFNLAFKSRRNVSKNHPLFFQKKVLDLYNSKVKNFEEAYRMKLTA